MKTKKINITGNVEIRAFGSYTEKFLNELMSSGINIVDVKNENGIIYFTCARTKYKRVVNIARNFGVKIKLINRVGVYFKIRPYFKRYGIILGALGFCFVIYIMSNFIWDIKINGNEKITENQIKEIINEAGISIGAYRKGINSELAELTAMIELDELAWINIEINGSRVNIKLSERTTEEDVEIPVSTPCNIVAQRTGVIVETEVYRGKLLLEKGSGVNKGDLIVSGTVEDGGGNLLLQHANAKIIAECEDISEFFVPFTSEKQKHSGVITKKQYLMFLGKAVPLFTDGNIPENSRYTEEMSRVKILWFDTPFRIKTCCYEEFEIVETKLTNGMALQELDEKIEIYKNNMFKDAEIISDDIEYIPQNDGIKAIFTVKYKVNIAVKERIGLT